MCGQRRVRTDYGATYPSGRNRWASLPRDRRAAGTRAAAMKRPRGHYALFESVIGRCGIGWSEAGILRVQLPEATEEKTVRRLAADGAVSVKWWKISEGIIQHSGA